MAAGAGGCLGRTVNDPSTDMKLASYKDGSRDGQLVVVSGDLGSAHYATGIATRLQQVLDDWNFLSPQLQELSQTLDHGKARHAFPFDPRLCLAPLPRAFLWAEPGGGADDEPVPGRSDTFLGPCDPVPCGDGAADLQVQLAAITGDLPPGTGPDAALDGVRLLMLTDTGRWWRDAAAAGTGRPDAHWQGFAPVAITPDELGSAWRGGRGTPSLTWRVNGQRLGAAALSGHPQAHLGQLIARLAALRGLPAGCIVGAGVAPAEEGTSDEGLIAALRRRESGSGGSPGTPWLRAGDRWQLEATGETGQSLFGAVERLCAGSA
jgi:fumarylacetoacetate (FAA) hydrolase